MILAYSKICGQRSFNTRFTKETTEIDWLSSQKGESEWLKMNLRGDRQELRYSQLYNLCEWTVAAPGSLGGGEINS